MFDMVLNTPVKWQEESGKIENWTYFLLGFANLLCMKEIILFDIFPA